MIVSRRTPENYSESKDLERYCFTAGYNADEIAMTVLFLASDEINTLPKQK